MCGPQLGQVTAHPQPGQRQRRVGAGGHDQAQRLRQVRDEELDGLVNAGIGEHLVVVEHQHVPAGRRGQLVQQQRQRQVDHRPVGRADGLQGRLADVVADPAQRGEHVTPEPGGLVVVLVERDPGDAPPLPRVGRPAAQQARLAPPGRRHHHGQPGAGVAQLPGQPFPRNRTLAHRRNHLLGGEQRPAGALRHPHAFGGHSTPDPRPGAATRP
jgi:hypothetical protein